MIALVAKVLQWISFALVGLVILLPVKKTADAKDIWRQRRKKLAYVVVLIALATIVITIVANSLPRS